VAPPLLLVSTHLDDAVLSCGDLLSDRPGSVVATALSADPRPGTALTGWDRAAGFTRTEEVMAARRAEDRGALGSLGAVQVLLGELDGQYEPRPGRPDRLARLLDALVADQPAEEVLVPLGVAHPDHIEVGAACRAAARRHPDRRWTVYLDLPYGHAPALAGLTGDALDQVAAEGHLLGPPEEGPGAPGAAKRAAVEHYRSQLAPVFDPTGPFVFPEHLGPERRWPLGPGRPA
jgi:LmbE family N-acetylglucosaminyl deacetylase